MFDTTILTPDTFLSYTWKQLRRFSFLKNVVRRRKERMSYIRSRDSDLTTAVNYTNLWSFRHFCLSTSVIVREYFAHLSKLWYGIIIRQLHIYIHLFRRYMVPSLSFFPNRNPNKKRFATFGFVLRRPQ